MSALTMNKIFYERYIRNDFYLSLISFDDESLYIKKDNIIEKKVLFNDANDLSLLPIECYKINDPYQFLDVLQINIECEKKAKELDELYGDDLKSSQKTVRYFIDTRSLLSKKQSSKDDLEKIKDFLNKYNELVKANGYLTDNAKLFYNEMSSILNWTLDDENFISTNFAQKIIRQYIDNLNKGNIDTFISLNANEGSVNNQGMKRTLSNPNAHSVISDDLNMDRAGFFNFLALLYVAFNLIIALVVLAIKK